MSYVSEGRPNNFWTGRITPISNSNSVIGCSSNNNNIFEPYGYTSAKYLGTPNNVKPSGTKFSSTAIETKEWYERYLRESQNNPHPIKDNNNYDPENAWDVLSAEVHDIIN